ncbi:MAG: GNAT family N-acetyltransferase [Bacteroidetes bacterium]|nr:MAG: GNAT family N-acetyltransferase [Bacteroidota bacterium]
MIEIKRFRNDEKVLFGKALKIRENVFVKEQQVPPELEYDGFENESHHYLLFYNDEPIATARWRKTENGIKLERFALLPEYRDKGIGTKLLQRVMEDISPFGKTIYLHAQLKAVPYYERVGFVKKGDIFVEAGIEHYLMEKT